MPKINYKNYLKTLKILFLSSIFSAIILTSTVSFPISHGMPLLAADQL